MNIEALTNKLFKELNISDNNNYGIIHAINDTVKDFSVSDCYRPYMSCDIKYITKELKVDNTRDILTNVALSFSAIGNNKGFFSYPDKGTIVKIEYINHNNQLPYISQIIPLYKSLDKLNAGTQKWQQNIEIEQKIDESNNWTRTTNTKIEDECNEYSLNTTIKTESISKEYKELGESEEQVLGGKKLTAGNISLASQGNNFLGSGANTNIISEKDLNILVGQIVKLVSTKEQILKSKKTWIGSENENVLNLLINFMSQVIDALQVLSSHTHPKVSTISQGGAVSSKASAIEQLKNTLESITKKT